MATREQLLEGLRRADAAGNADDAAHFARLLKAVSESERLATLPPPTAVNVSGDMPRAMREEMAGRSWLENNLASAGNALRGPYEGIRQLLGIEDKQNVEAVRTMDQEAPIGAIAGNVALFAAPGLSSGNVLRSTVTGATAGGLQPTLEDESRAVNAAVGGAVSGAGAAAFKYAPKAYRAGKEFAGRYLGGMTGSHKMMAPALRKDVGSAIGTIATPADEAALASFKQHPFLTHTPTVAQITQSPTISSAEKASRVSLRDFWANKDEIAAASRWRALDDALGTKATEDAAKATREQVTRRMRDIALKGTIKPQESKAFVSSLDRAARAKDAPRDAVSVAGYLKSEVDRIGGADEITPKFLYQKRKEVTDWIKGTPPPGQQQISAPSSDPYMISLKNKIDDMLNTSSKGRFAKYLKAYADESPAVVSERAGRNIRNKLVDEVTGVPRFGMGTADGVPKIPLAPFRNAVNQFGKDATFGKETLNIGTDDVVRAVLSDMERGQILQRLNLAQTGGGGSNTAGDLLRAGGGIAGGWKGSLFAKFLGDVGSSKYDTVKSRTLAEALADPTLFRSVLDYQNTVKALPGKDLQRALNFNRFVGLPASQWLIEQ